MKSKKLLVVSISLVVLSLVISFIYGFCNPKLPELVAKTQKSYRFLFGLRCFLAILPAVLSTAYLIGWAADFGENAGGSRVRFSTAMFDRYKSVLVTSLITVFVLVCVQEIALPNIDSKLQTYERLPKLLAEYKKFANGLYGHGRYELAYGYAKLAAAIDENDTEAIRLLNDAAIARNKLEAVPVPESDEAILENEIQSALSTPSVSAGRTEQLSETNDDGANPENPFTTFRLLQLAKDAFSQKKWFDAHYYAQLALAAAAPTDVNTTELKQISAESWNRLSETQTESEIEAQQIFARKRQGYVALLENDNLKAYYIFKALSQQSRALAIDPDIEKYLGIAESRLQELYFFTDETFDLIQFEAVQDVRFKIDRTDGSTDLFFISGVTNSGTGDGFVQYLRGLRVFSIGADGNCRGATFTPYAKMSAVSARYFTDDDRQLFGIDKDIQSVPFVLLRSVDRNTAPESDAEFPIMQFEEVQQKNEDETMLAPESEEFQQKNDGYLILPMEFGDFTLIQEASGPIKNMPLPSLMRFIGKAKQYGYAEETFAQALLNRLFYPLFMLIFLICLACFAWNGRTPPHSLFKLKWAVLFPIFCAIFIGLYKAAVEFFCLLNYGILYSASVSLMIPAGIAVYVLLLLLISIGFLACRDSSKE